MDFVVAIVVAILLNGLVLAYLQRTYDAELSRQVTIAYVCTIALRYAIGLFLWLNYQQEGFAHLFWGDSGLYDTMGASVAEAWSYGGTTHTWLTTLEGRVNNGFIYFVAAVYYVFGRNTLLMQLINGVIGALTSIAVLELGLLLYDRRTAFRAMLFAAFFPR